MTTMAAQLRSLIEAPEIVVLPGVHDTLSALIAERCGAKAIAAGGYAATASLQESGWLDLVPGGWRMSAKSISLLLTCGWFPSQQPAIIPIAALSRAPPPQSETVRLWFSFSWHGSRLRTALLIGA